MYHRQNSVEFTCTILVLHPVKRLVTAIELSTAIQGHVIRKKSVFVELWFSKQYKSKEDVKYTEIFPGDQQ
jgi:hypothetical protein